MSREDLDLVTPDLAPGDERTDESNVAGGVLGYLVGLALATLLTDRKSVV